MSLWCKGDSHPYKRECAECPQQEACLSVSNLIFPIECWRIVAEREWILNLQNRLKTFAWEHRVKMNSSIDKK